MPATHLLHPDRIAVLDDPAVRVHLLALVLGQQAVELVRQQVDRGVHVHAAGIRVQGPA
jgi:hypothetical protein